MSDYIIQNNIRINESLAKMDLYIGIFKFLAFFVIISGILELLIAALFKLNDLSSNLRSVFFILVLIQIGFALISFLTCAFSMLINIGRRLFTKEVSERFAKLEDFTKQSKRNTTRNAVIFITGIISLIFVLCNFIIALVWMFGTT